MSQSPTPPSPTPSRLLILPLELQKDILDALDLPSRLYLRLTNRHFNSLIPRPTHTTLLTAEKTPWALTRSLYTCMDCLRLRPSKYFADAMLKGPKGRNGKEPYKRFCVECGIRSKGRGGKGYSPGAEIEVQGRKSVVCKRCGEFRSENEGEGEKEVGGGGGGEGSGSVGIGCKGSGLCGKCHGDGGSCKRLGKCSRGNMVIGKKRKRGGGGYGGYGLYGLYGRFSDPPGYWGRRGGDVHDDDYGLPEGYDEAFWECYDPAD